MSRRQLAAAAVMLCALSAGYIAVGASGAPAKKPAPRGVLQSDWVPSHPGANVLRKSNQFGVSLDLEDFRVVPKMIITLYLPKGVHILRQELRYIDRMNVHSPPPPGQTSKFGRSPAGRPVWVYTNLHNSPFPAWVFWVNAPKGAKQVCVSATARSVGVPNTLTEKGQGCVPFE